MVNYLYFCKCCSDLRGYDSFHNRCHFESVDKSGQAVGCKLIDKERVFMASRNQPTVLAIT